LVSLRRSSGMRATREVHLGVYGQTAITGSVVTLEPGDTLRGMIIGIVRY
jgi:hypothetical protein